ERRQHFGAERSEQLLELLLGFLLTFFENQPLFVRRAHGGFEALADLGDRLVDRRRRAEIDEMDVAVARRRNNPGGITGRQPGSSLGSADELKLIEPGDFDQDSPL